MFPEWSSQADPAMVGYFLSTHHIIITIAQRPQRESGQLSTVWQGSQGCGSVLSHGWCDAADDDGDEEDQPWVGDKI